MIQTLESAIRVIVMQEIALLSLSPIVGIVVFDILILHFAITTGQKQGQLFLWAFAAAMAVIATIQIVGSK